jgi:hypothetical protein
MNSFMLSIATTLLLLLPYRVYASSGSVDTTLSDSNQDIVETPKNYKSPLLEIKDYFIKMHSMEDKIINSKNKLNNPNWNTYLSWREAFELSEKQQQQTERELAETGEIELKEGQSYAFDLDSFCVDAGKTSPVNGDEFRIAKIKGAASEYLPQILKKYSSNKYEQEEVQTLIWQLLNDVRYNELEEQQQTFLKEVFPNADIRFGDKKAGNFIKNIFNKAIPDELSEPIKKMQELRNTLQEYANDYKKLEKVFAPKSNRMAPLSVGWMKMNEGYYLKIHSIESYQKVRVEIYVPEDEARKPSSISKRVFRPLEWITLPEQGQRLALSPKSKREKNKSTIDVCNELKKWKPQNCKEMTDYDRDRILEIADPVNFSKTRYQSPPSKDATIEEETDCSHFVQEIYNRAGFKFTYSPTSTFNCLQVFQETENSKEVKPGDLVLFYDHIGIFTKDGRVISATVGGGEEKRAKLEINDKRFKSSISINSTTDFTIKHKEMRFLKWKCK